MIGILNAYHFDATPGNFQENYNKLILEYVRKIFPNESIREYKIAFGDWPKSTSECEVWFVTGSAKSAYDLDEWITQLKQFIIQLDKHKSKLVGICFGHQIIAQSLGGRVEKSSKGWGVGVKSYKVIKNLSWMQPPLDQVSLLFSHQDQVEVIPPNAELLAEDSFCSNQMFQIGKHILTFQGHPEFDTEFAKERLVSRKEKMSLETFQIAMDSFSKSNDSKILIEWIRNFIHQG